MKATEVKFAKQAATKELKDLRRVREILNERITDEAERNLILSFLAPHEEAAEEQLRNPRARIIVHTTMRRDQDLSQHQEILEVPMVSRRRGAPGREADTLNANVTLLSRSLLTLEGKASYWPLVAELLCHFCPSEFSPSEFQSMRRRMIDRIKDRVRDFTDKGSSQEILQKRERILERQVARLLQPIPS